MPAAGKKSLDTSYHRRRLEKKLRDPEFKAEYERARAEISQIDEIIRTLDRLREAAGFSKAELARLVGKDPASIRRLFSATSNPELKTVTALASALDARVEIVPRTRGLSRASSKTRQKTA